MYFSIALSSFIFNLSALIGYFRSVKTANLASTIATWFSFIILAANIIVWAVAAAIYKYEKGVTDDQGKHDDLWGWTCSGPAKAIQETFHEVPFDKYCNIQSASWYAGLVQVGAMVLSAIIFLLAWRRKQVKKQVRRSMSDRLTPHQY
jgi:putative Mn2+ efflux pump MntP